MILMREVSSFTCSRVFACVLPVSVLKYIYIIKNRRARVSNELKSSLSQNYHYFL